MIEQSREVAGVTNTSNIGRRAFLQTGGAAALATAHVGFPSIVRAQSRTIKIGFIGAQSGVRANFGETTPWTIERIQAIVKPGLKIGGKSYAVEIVVKDDQSDPNRASVVSSELLLREK